MAPSCPMSCLYTPPPRFCSAPVGVEVPGGSIANGPWCMDGVGRSIILRLANRYNIHPLQLQDIISSEKERMKVRHGLSSGPHRQHMLTAPTATSLSALTDTQPYYSLIPSFYLRPHSFAALTLCLSPSRVVPLCGGMDKVPITVAGTGMSAAVAGVACRYAV